jgi:hypothetical protein
MSIALQLTEALATESLDRVIQKILDTPLSREQWGDEDDDIRTVLDYRGTRRSTPPKVRFGASRPYHREKARPETVEIGKLVATQPTVGKGKVIDIIRKNEFEGRPLPWVLRWPDGQLTIADGHHRLDAALRAGRRRAKVAVTDIDPVDDRRR